MCPACGSQPPRARAARHPGRHASQRAVTRGRCPRGVRAAATSAHGYKVTLEKQGESERNGKGSVRRVNLPGMSLVEEVVYFDAPVEMRYSIREGMAGLQYHLGTIKLRERDGRTHIHWHVDATMKPLHPMWFLRPITALLFKRGFQKALTGLKTELEKS
ncbi:MAG TPA: SRPBCC family protein [Polyangiales bacterium]